MTEAYEIIDGVRRAKAAMMAGHATIAAWLMTPDGANLIDEFDVELESLYSPCKDQIERITAVDEHRWENAVRGAQNAPFPFPPIIINRGSRGARLEDVTFDFGIKP